MRLLLLLSLLTLVFSGCQQTSETGSSSEPVNQRTELNYANIDEPKRLDPAFIKDYYEGIVSGFLFDGLVNFTKGTDVEPALAERWEVSPDGRTYTFHLRKDAKFSNGQPITSRDVEYSFTRVLLPGTQSDRKWVLNRIDGADEVSSGTAVRLRGLQTPDPHTVVIVLKEPYPVFLTMLAMPNAVIIPDKSAGADSPDPAFDRKPLGSGPWKLTEWVHDQRLVFLRNEHYWGKRPAVERLVYHVQVDDNVRRQQFQLGQHDIYQVGFAHYEAWMNDPTKRAITQEVQELRTEFFGFMNDKPMFQDKRVRQAIAHGINREAIFRNLQKSRGVLAHGPVPPGIQGYRNDIAPRSYDPEKAKQLLAEAGATNLEIQIWYRDDALSGEIVASAKDDLAKIGITVKPTPRDLASLRAGIHNGDADMYLGSWTLDYPDVENILVPCYHSRNIPRQGNGSHFRNKQIDSLIEAAEAESDSASRLEKFARVEDAVIEECPWVFLFHRQTHYAAQSWMKGWKPAVMYNAERFTDVQLSERPVSN